MAGTITPTYSGAQLTSSSSAAQKYGVPVNIVRNVTGYKYGSGASAGQFNYVASQLAHWYSQFFKQSGNALVAWGKAAAQEMPGANAAQVAAATSNQSAAKTGMVLAPAIGLGAAAAGAGAADAAAVNAATGATDAASGVAAADAGAAGAGAAGAGAGLAGTAGIAAAITDAWQSAVGDAKYAGVLIGVLALGAMLIFHAFGGSGGGGQKVRIIPAP